MVSGFDRVQVHWQVGSACNGPQQETYVQGIQCLRMHMWMPCARVDSLLPDGPRNVTGLGGSAPLSHFTGL